MWKDEIIFKQSTLIRKLCEQIIYLRKPKWFSMSAISCIFHLQANWFGKQEFWFKFQSLIILLNLIKIPDFFIDLQP